MLCQIRIMAALLVFPILLAVPVSAQAESPVEVSRNEAIADFPETISFYLDAESSLTIEKAEIEYRVERQECGLARSRVPVELEPDTAISASWVWKMRVTHPLPPGSRVWWRWRITLQDGSEERTEEKWLTFEDTNHTWETVSQQGITVFWYKGDQSFAEDLLEAGIEGLERLAADPQDVLQQPVQVFVYNSPQDLKDAVIFSPDWIGGRAYTSYSIILMAIPPGRVEYGQEVLRHELSHLVVHQLVYNCWGNDIPSWLDEGLAVYAEGEQPRYDTLMDAAIENDELLTLQILSGSFSADDEQASLSYAQSYRVVRYLIDTYGREPVLDLLAQIGDGVPIDRALEAVYGFDTEGLEVEWREAVSARALARPTATPSATPETVTAVEATEMATPSPTSGITPTPLPVMMALSHSPPADLQEARLVLAPSLVGGDARSSAPIWPLIAGAVLIAAALVLVVLAWRRRLPWWPAPLALVAGCLLLAGYGLAHRNAQTYNQAADAFQQGQWAEALAGFDEVLDAQPAFLRANQHVALANWGAAALNLGHTEDARAGLEGAIGAAPQHPAMDLARTYLARWHLLHGQSEDALGLLDEALAGQPGLVPALALRAEVRWRLEDVAGAASDAESILGTPGQGGNLPLDQALGSAHAVRGAARLLPGEVDQALVDAEEALALLKTQALAYAVRGGARLKQGQTVDAYADAETALALEPGLPLALAVRAGAQLAAGQPAPAAQDAAAAYQARPSFAWAHALHAAAALQLHDPETATSQAQLALALDPDATLAQAVEAGVALSAHRLDDAWRAANQALESDPEQGLALAVRAVVHLHGHRPTDALQDAEAALSAQPYLALAHAAMAEASLALGDVETALQAADRAVALDGDLALGHAARAGARLQRLEVLSGLEDSEQAVTLDPDLALGRLRRGAAYLALHRLALAEADLDQALALDESLALALVYQAELALARSDLEAALERAEAALERDPDLALAHTWRALALDGMGRFEEAEAAVAEALALDAELPQAYLVRAMLSERRGDVEGTLDDLDTALGLAPNYAPAYQMRAFVRLGQADYEGGQADADRAVSKLPSVLTYAARANLHQFLGQYEEALDDLDRAEELAPESALPSIGQVWWYEARHDRQTAIAKAEEAITREAGNPDAHSSRAWLHRQHHEYEAAHQAAEEALALNPWSVPALVQRAFAEMSSGDLDAAMASADRAVALAPGSPDARQSRGAVYLQTGNTEEAMADLHEAVELEPGSPSHYLLRAMAAAMSDSPTPARDDLDQAIALMPDDPHVHWYAAEVLLALGEPQAAIEACDEALALDPEMAVAYLLRGEVYLVQNDPSKAALDLSRSLRLDPSSPEGYALRAEAYLMQGKLEKASGEAEKALSLDDRADGAHLVLCQAQFYQQEFQAALEQCDRAVELAPDDARAYSARGSVHMRLGQLDEALADLDEAVRLAPEWLEAYMNRAGAYELQGRFEEAIRDLEEAQGLTEDPDTQGALSYAIELLQNTQMAVDGPATYTDERYGYSIRYPEGWQQGPDSQGYGAVQLAGPMEEGYRSVVIVYVELGSPYASLSEMADEMNRQLQWTMSGYEVLERQDAQLGGEPAMLQVCRTDLEPAGQMRLWLVLAIRGRQAVGVTLAAHSDHFAAAEPKFQEILDSFAFTD